jgi:hypothetical protein
MSHHRVAGACSGPPFKAGRADAACSLNVCDPSYLLRLDGFQQASGGSRHTSQPSGGVAFFECFAKCCFGHTLATCACHLPPAAVQRTRRWAP